MSLQQTAAEFKAKVQGMLGEKFSILTGDMERVRAEGTVDNALKVGQSAPVFTLPDAFGDQVSLTGTVGQRAGGGQFLPRRVVPVLQYRTARTRGSAAEDAGAWRDLDSDLPGET